MKLRTLFGILCVTLYAICLTACKDDDSYPPISLGYADASGSIVNGGTLIISPYNEGETFHIQGGYGGYFIECSNRDIADFSYDGKALTISPEGLGEAVISISDNGGYRFTMTVVVKYPDQTYTVDKVDAQITGAKLTLEERDELERRIRNACPVSAGGKYIFTYTDMERTQGRVSIYPYKDAMPVEGIFNQDKAEMERSGINIHITLTNGTVYDLILVYASAESSSRTEMTPEMYLKQNVTDTYKIQYPALEEAWCIQRIPGQTL